MGRPTLHYVTKETCEAIWETLQHEVLKVPSHDEWVQIARDFEDMWNFPHCLGAIDGKHVVIQAPKLSGSAFFNYKNQHSVVLLAVSDAKYRFTLVDIGSSGRNSDGGIFARSLIGQFMEQGRLNTPAPSPVGECNLPYVFVGDEAFPLKPYLMRPFPARDLLIDAKEEEQLYKGLYNYRHCRARRIIENAFGVWSGRWRIFKKPIIADTENVILYVKATLCLHNWLRTLECDINNPGEDDYCPPGYVDKELGDGTIQGGVWRQGESGSLSSVGKTGSNNHGTEAVAIRKQFMNYFTSPEGAVSWQIDHVLRGIVDN